MTDTKAELAGLKPCPFCGGEAYLMGQIPCYSGAWVECLDCDTRGANCRVIDDVEAANRGAVEYWNTRQPDTTLSARIEALEGALTALMDLNDNHSPFGGEMYQDRIDRTWERARTALADASKG